MNEVLPIGVLLALGGLFGWMFQRRKAGVWMSSLLGALAASLVWVGGFYLLAVLFAPGELGPPLIAVLIQIYFTSLVSAGAAAGLSSWLSDPARGGDEECFPEHRQEKRV